MDAKMLPLRPSLEQYRKQAKDLLHASRAGDCEAMQRISHCPRVQKAGVDYALADAQFVIAHEHGFESWSKFSAYIEALTYQSGPVARFEAAANAVVAGNEDALERLLRDHPELVHARSTRAHHATLLHYASANGVEDFRQKTPANAVAIARRLLEAGAAVDAQADTYGGGAHQTTLNLLVSSVHPARAGVQVALVDTLLDFGAAIDGPANDGSPLHTALAFYYPDAADALARRGARVNSILAAAGLGREDLVRRLAGANGELREDVPLAAVPWIRWPKNAKAHAELALIWAAALGWAGVVDFLSRQRVELVATDNQGFTALH